MMATAVADAAEYDFSHVGNSLRVVVTGRLYPEGFAQFINKFQEEARKLKPAETELRFDITGLRVVNTNLQTDVEYCFQLFKQIGFKNIVLEIKNNVILSMQLKRIAKEAGLENLEII